MLCLTYVPVVTSLLNGPRVNGWGWLRKAENATGRLSHWIMRLAYRCYRPALLLSLRHKGMVIGMTLGGVYRYSRVVQSHGR